MQSQTSFKLRTLLLGTTALSSILLVILLLISMFSLHKMQVADTEEHRLTQGLGTNIADARFHIVQVQQFLTDASATGDREGIQDAATHYAALQTNLANIASLDLGMSGDVAKVTERAKVFFEVGKTMTEAYIAQGRDAGNAIMKQPQTGFDDRAEALTNEMDALAARVSKANLEMINGNQSNLEQFSLIIISLTLLTAAVVIASGIFTYRKVFKTLGGEPSDAVAVADRIANGDLSHHLDGEKGSLFEAFGRMQVQLKQMTGRIRDLSMELQANANNLSSASQVIQTSSHQQSTAAATMAGSMQNIAANVDILGKRTADIGLEAVDTQKSISNCEETIHSTANTIRQIANEIQQAAGAVHDLNKQTDQIASITHTIREISDQTNLLALNAAIEAARAGETGRGFAVVADEVRKLAERAGNATVEISAQIQAIRSSVEHAVTMMQSSVSASAASVDATEVASESISGIRENTHQITLHIQEIVSSLAGQQQEIQQISNEIDNVAQLTLSNQQSVDNTASAALQMQSHAGELADATAAFRG